jgi:twitching motility protein PilT
MSDTKTKVTTPSIIGSDTSVNNQTIKVNNQQNATTVTQLATDINSLKMQHLLQAMVAQGASDLHLVVNSAPAIRVSGEIVRLNLPVLTPEATQRIIMQVLTDPQKSELLKKRQVDFSFGVKNLARFRASVFYAQGNLSAVLRTIPSVIPEFEKLGLPNVLMDMCKANNGLILVTGPTGSGKSTTLASMIDKINRSEQCHIITLEDPIEFVHQHRNSIINQREIGSDADSFQFGLRSMLRQDPDIVLVGELRDVETIEAALTIAETGHIVFGTLHTNSTVQTINRIINVFPADKQDQVRSLLSFVLQGIIAQQLVPKIGGGRQLIQEILRPNMGIRNLIRENKIHQIYSQMQIGQEESLMFTMNQSLKTALDRGVITKDNAINYSNNVEEMMKMLNPSMMGTKS